MNDDDRAQARDAQAPSATFTCQGCGATFATRAQLHLHNAETHGGGSTGGSTDEPPGGSSDDGPSAEGLGLAG